jgi:four helix bundle protein
MKQINSAEELDVFKKAHQLTLRIYTITAQFPVDERFGLVSQMRRAAVSIASNLIEGSYRLNTGEFRQFVGIARGSAGELKYGLMVARDLGYISEKDYAPLRTELDDIAKMLMGLAKSLS